MKIALIVFWVGVVALIVYAIRLAIKRKCWWHEAELRIYIDDLFETACPHCFGTGYESYTRCGEPTGEFCESCESYGYVWRTYSAPPRWLKHGPMWTESEKLALEIELEAKR